MKSGISIIIPVYNEAEIIQKSLADCLSYLIRNRINNFEIIVVCNGCTDASVSKVVKLAREEKKIKLVEITKKGLGLALKKGINLSSYDWIYFLPADNPFNFIELDTYKIKNKDFDILYTSKNHQKAVYKNRPFRKIASKIYSFIVRTLFSLTISDTQGTFLGKNQKLKALMPFCTSETAFFQTQLAIYAFKKGYKIREIPVRYIPKSSKSKFSIPIDGLFLFIELFREKFRFEASKQSNRGSTSFPA